MVEETEYSEVSVERQEEFWEQPFQGYQVLNILGRGKSGSVLLARDTRFERDVVIKTMAPVGDDLEGAVERFFYDARQVARLKHENLVRGYDVGRTPKYFYFVTEYIRGESLQGRLEGLQQGKIRELESLKYVMQVADALQFIHEQGLMHRDVKPSNILIDNKGVVKLADFGMAKDLTFLSAEDAALANCEIASPEVASADPIIDIRSDLYSLGCCWFRMLLGRYPFTGESAAVVLRKHISDDPEMPHEVDSRITPATGQLIMWLLNKDRERRPRTPQQFVSKLMTHPLVKLEQQQHDLMEADEAEEKNEDDDDALDDDEFVIYTGPGSKHQPQE